MQATLSSARLLVYRALRLCVYISHCETSRLRALNAAPENENNNKRKQTKHLKRMQTFKETAPKGEPFQVA